MINPLKKNKPKKNEPPTNKKQPPDPGPPGNGTIVCEPSQIELEFYKTMIEIMRLQTRCLLRSGEYLPTDRKEIMESVDSMCNGFISACEVYNE